MKKRASIIFGALVAICATSCQQAGESEQPQKEQDSYISAEINTDDLTKTHLNADKYVVWDSNDELKVKGSNGTAVYKLENGAGATRGVFKKTSGDNLTGSSFVAYSPASIFNGTNVAWPTSQQYVSEGCVSGAPMKAEASSLGEVFQFKNMGGLVCFRLKTTEGTKNISYIKIETEDNEIVLNCPEGGVAVDTEGKDFYLAVPAKESYSKFIVEAAATDGSAFQKVANKAIKVERSKITRMTTSADKWLYLISVSPTDKVIFSPGNLYCTNNGGKYTFAFEASQTDYRQRYDYDGEERAVINGVKGKTPANTSGLFQWVRRTSGSAVGVASYGAFAELDYDDANLVAAADGETVNFGEAYGDGKTWRTLSNEEWNYMVNVRKVGGATRYGNTCVWATFGYTQGLLIFPDGWTGPKSGFSDIPENAVFLPDAGYAFIEDGTTEIPNGKRGCYWASSSVRQSGGPDYWPQVAYGIHPEDGSVTVAGYYRSRGYSVRLVSDVWNVK